jgi:hypothetical protein
MIRSVAGFIRYFEGVRREDVVARARGGTARIC